MQDQMLTRFLFESDNAEGRLENLRVASHWFMHMSFKNGNIYNGPFCEKYVHCKYAMSGSYFVDYF